MGRQRPDARSQVSFSAPPPPERYDWAAIADQLRAKPGQWGLVFEKDRTSLVNAIRQGAVVALHPDLGFVTRTTNNTSKAPRMCTLYVKFEPSRVNPLTAALYEARQ